MGSLAEEFKQKQNREKIPSATEAAQENLWEYEKLIDPKFFKEERWHLKEIAETLQALVEDRIIRVVPEVEWHIAEPEEVKRLQEQGIKYQCCRKLKLNIPPRHGKSYSLQRFEQWYLGRNNENTVITVSYNETLSNRFSANVRDGIDATKIDKKITIFSDVFPNTKIKYGDAAKNIWALAGRFFNYLGTSFGGTLTGVGCRLGVIDDPVKSDKEAYNDTILQEQWDWYVDTYLSRIEEGGYQIIKTSMKDGFYPKELLKRAKSIRILLCGKFWKKPVQKLPLSSTLGRVNILFMYRRLTIRWLVSILLLMALR